MLHLCHGVITSFKAGWMKDDFSFELFFTVMSSLENSFFQFDLSLYDTKETRGPILQNAFNNNIREIASLLQLNWVCAKFIVVTNWLKRIGSWGFNENHQRGVFKKIDTSGCIFIMVLVVLSNLCTTTTIGTPKFWPLLIDGRCLEVSLKGQNGTSKWCLYRQLVAFRRWSFAQVWL